MQIESAFDIQFYLPQPIAMVALLHLHPAVQAQLLGAERLSVESLPLEQMGGGAAVSPEQLRTRPLRTVAAEEYEDVFGNRCTRFAAPAGMLRLSGSNRVASSEYPELQGFDAELAPVEKLPTEVLQFLLASRYCEVDKFGGIAQDNFGHMGTGWALAAAIRDWVHQKVAFDYQKARATKTAMDVFTERVGVCRDYQHLAITLSRCLNIPARYVTGYIGDIRMPNSGPGDFSAWYQVWLGGRWWDMDARHNYPRLGRVLMAVGRDAADVAITTSFGRADLTHFWVDSYEVDAEGVRVPPLPPQTPAAA